MAKTLSGNRKDALCRVCFGGFPGHPRQHPSCIYQTPNGRVLLALPFGIIEKDEHTSAFIILETLIVMTVSIANQVIKDSCINDV